MAKSSFTVDIEKKCSTPKSKKIWVINVINHPLPQATSTTGIPWKHRDNTTTGSPMSCRWRGSMRSIISTGHFSRASTAEMEVSSSSWGYPKLAGWFMGSVNIWWIYGWLIWLWVSSSWGYPIAGWFLWTGKSHLEIDDDLGVPLFQETPLLLGEPRIVSGLVHPIVISGH